MHQINDFFAKKVHFVAMAEMERFELSNRD